MNGHVAAVGMFESASEVNPSTMLASAAWVPAVSVGSREMFGTMCRAIEYHRIRPVVSNVMPWIHAREALQLLQSMLRSAKSCSSSEMRVSGGWAATRLLTTPTQTSL